MKILKLLLVALFLPVLAFTQDVVINEICSSNQTIITDAYDEFSDWIELYNNSNSTIDLKNFGLSDDVNEPRKWIFPQIEIKPKSYLLVFASKKNEKIGEELHTNFKINSSGETLILTNYQSIEIDLVESISIPNNQSFARISDGNQNWKIRNTPTPNASNQLNTEVDCSHPSGFYNTEFQLKLSTSNLNHKIFYTTNGSIPTAQSLIYTSPISINSKPENEYTFSQIPTTPLSGSSVLDDFVWQQPEAVQTSFVIRFAAFENGEIQTPIITKNYFIEPNFEERYKFPVVFITTDSLNLFGFENGIYVPGKRFADNGFIHFPEGNYLNEGSDWERDVHISYFENDGTLGFETNSGIRMHGNGSASYPQKSFKIYFRNEYGQNEIDYPIFPNSNNQKFKRLLFRNGGNDFLKTHFKDALLQNIISDLDIELQAFQPSVVFINGEYWGLHNIREKYDRFHFQYNFGLDKDSINVLKIDGRIEEGSNKDYLNLIDFVNENDLSIEANYDFIKSKIDLANFIDFQIAEIYFANYDWPCNNFKIWKSNDSKAKWRYAIYDLDYSFGHDSKSNYTINSLEHATSESNDWPHCQISNTIFRNLLKNKNFELQFLNRFSFCLKNTFNANQIIGKIDDFKTLYESEIEEHISRWHYPNSIENWKAEIDILKEFARERPCFMADQIISFFELSEFDFDCENVIGRENRLTIFPNPSNGNFTISNNNFEKIENAQLTIFNYNGQIIFNEENISIRKNEDLSIETNLLPFGVYVLILNDGKRIIKKRFIISKNE